MKDQNEKVDLLLEKNAAEQLGGIDWEQLNTAISSRLDQVGQVKAPSIKYPILLKAAAGLAAAAAVILIALPVVIDRPSGLQLPNGRSAIVKVLEPAGSASVVIERIAAKQSVFIEIGQAGQKLAKCDVEIIDLNGDAPENGGRAAWIIISRPEPIYADNGTSRDMTDIISLF
jgi:hypothetical protein